jgi:hypothetical protein
LKLSGPLPGIPCNWNFAFLEQQQLKMNMKLPFPRTLSVALLAGSLTLNTWAEPAPGYVDFGKLAASKDGEFVEVQVSSNLLSLAAQFVEKQEPDAAKLLRSVQLVRVNVIGITDENRDALQKQIKSIGQQLEAKGWDCNVKVRGKNGEDVGVYTQTRGGQALAGLAITVQDAEHVVLANVVGDIKPEQVAALGESLNIKSLKEAGDALKK